MRRFAHRFAVACAGALCMLVLAPAALADPSDNGDDIHSHDHSGPPELAAFDGPSIDGMTLVGNSDKDGTTNSDMAFWGDLAFAGNYHGFRILDISGAEPEVLVDYYCRGPQNDVSVYRMGGRLLLFQSVDTPQSQESCDGTQAGSSTDQPLDAPANPRQRKPGFEGIRIFDVTDPADPEFIDGVPTACGSHTHTLIPDQRRKAVYLYVTSYPLGSNITPPGHPEFDGPRCKAPHQKISIIRVPFDNPRAWDRREEKLSSDTDPYPGASSTDPLAPPFIACHDVQVHMATKTAVGSCAGDAQIWDVTNPWNPSASDDESHTHIRSPSSDDEFEFVHNAVITWDGKVAAISDETGGGVTNECDGSPEPEGESENGFTYFYDMVRPGDPAPELRSRFMIPRPQNTQTCVSHNGNVLPVSDRYLMVQAYYQGGNSLVDFTDPSAPEEIAYADLTDDTGTADSWSTYWYNDRVYANGGLGRTGATGNRGLDVFTLDDVSVAKRWSHSNPQTQEAFQAP